MWLTLKVHHLFVWTPSFTTAVHPTSYTNVLCPLCARSEQIFSLQYCDFSLVFLWVLKGSFKFCLNRSASAECSIVKPVEFRLSSLSTVFWDGFFTLVWLKRLKSLYKVNEQKHIASWWQLMRSGLKNPAWQPDFIICHDWQRNGVSLPQVPRLVTRPCLMVGRTSPAWLHFPPCPSGFKKNLGHWFWGVSHVTLPLVWCRHWLCIFELSKPSKFTYFWGANAKMIKEWGKAFGSVCSQEAEGAVWMRKR